ncbi:RdgB/HAM1 family non-canonical purine NTP pyrophosphatase [Sphingomonas sp. Leaf343]|uniref:RdgB/HAM1 family non-canonical purine NTP pyrophosphatase n=1 Tax=Sphingomonas sp. Leaf343 TaxID=1736345 RepID=UPI0006FF681A|nr:RdgB/HAM1 family non-canonical purine NTP pyrophosphatase [Sphingomonas sp. Leaf343]KQR80885.1 non-canonical purine NTP pyrophosphatase [Sphingomonas sp. Leaf343]
MSGEGKEPQAIRKLAPGKLVIASHNPGKVREIAALLEGHGLDVVSAASLDLPEPEETGTTFVMNAELKARAAADLSGLPALADDSGLCVDALDGDPGIFSARWGGPDKDFGMAMRLIEDHLGRIEAETGTAPARSAHFVCALALAWPDGHVEWFEGRVDGTLVSPVRGDKGHGYDPMFVPDGHDRSFGEMDDALKNEISHRADAFRQMVAAVF